MSICVSEGWRKKGVCYRRSLCPCCIVIERLLFVVGTWVPGANRGADPGSSHAPPSPRTSTVRNDLCFLLLHTLPTPHIYFYLIVSPHCLCMCCPFTWNALFFLENPSSLQTQLKVSSVKCATPSRVDSSLLVLPQIRCSPPLRPPHPHPCPLLDCSPSFLYGMNE